MAITATGQNAATATATTQATVASTSKSQLSKDDFMKLFLTELQYQDPTAPMDTEKILAQTSQLATIESADNTNQALTDLTAALGQTKEFSTISAIGKMADTGSDGIAFDQGTDSVFEIYFPADVKLGSVIITDETGKEVGAVYDVIDESGKKINDLTNPQPPLTAGVYRFAWNGADLKGGKAESGIYHVNATYIDSNNTTAGIQKTSLGAYPIESERFENGKTFVKLGSSYVPLENIVEVY